MGQESKKVKTTKPRLWTASFTLLTLANFSASMSFYLTMATMASYAVSAFAASNTQAGLVNSALIFGAWVSRLTVGQFVQKHGNRTALYCSAAGLFCSVFCYLIVTNLAVLLLVRAAHGFSLGFAQTVMGAVVLSEVPQSRRGEGSGWYTTGLSLATGFAPFLGLTLYHSQLGQNAIVGVAVLSVTLSSSAILLTLFLTNAKRISGQTNTNATGLNIAQSITSEPEIPDAEKENKVAPDLVKENKTVATSDKENLEIVEYTYQKQGKWRRSLRRYLDPRVIPIGTVVALMAFTFGTILTFLEAYASRVHLESAAQWYFVVYALVILISRPIAGVVQDKRGDRIVVIPTIISIIFGAIVTATATSGWQLLLGGALVGFGYGTMISASLAIAVNRVGRLRSAIGISSLYVLIDFGTGISPIIMGSLITPIGYRWTITVAGLLSIPALAIYLISEYRTDSSRLVRKSKTRPENRETS